jgi:hypothetical protein
LLYPLLTPHQGLFFRVVKEYSVTVQHTVKEIQELDPSEKPLLKAYLDDKINNDALCKGLDFGTYLTTPVKSMSLPCFSLFLL